jgi:Spy/CpxP family protein refolding chaperone
MMVAAERAPWQNPRILSTLMVVFLAGAATGALSMQLGLHDRLHRPVPRAVAQNREAILNQFKTELGLTQPQAEKLGMVLDDYRQYYQSLQDQLEDLRATGKTRIIAILDPEQRKKFEKMMTDLDPQLTGKP